MADNSIWVNIGKTLLQLFINKEKEDSEKTKKTLAPVTLDVKIPFDSGKPVQAAPVTNDPNYVNMSIDWTDPKCQVTAHFNVADCLMLHSWNRLATPEQDGVTDGGKARLVTLCQKMEEIRTLLGCSINVHCMYRSPDYNAQVVKAIPNDVHARFEACDFDAGSKHTIDEVHSILEPKLEEMGIRMERNTPTWVHIDLHTVGNARYFNA